jgi:cytochrome P450
VPSEELNAAMAPTIREMNDYFRDHLRQRRRSPSEDLLGRLAGAVVDGEALHDDEVVGFAGLLLLAGHITTTSLLGNAVLCLAAHPAAGRAVRAEPALLPPALEEVLRLRAPFPRLARVTTGDVRVGGCTIPPHSLVIPWVGAANRDPERFPDPERFLFGRTNAHLAFGHGIHFCVGAPLARLESRIALRVLFSRYRDLAVDHGRIAYHNPWVMLAPRSMPVQVTPVA